MSWSPPATRLQNGEIISYRVVVTRTGSSVKLNTTTESTQYSISNVYPYVTYTVSVSAINSAGEGPPLSINQTTGSEGITLRYTQILHYNTYIHQSPCNLHTCQPLDKY